MSMNNSNALGVSAADESSMHTVDHDISESIDPDTSNQPSQAELDSFDTRESDRLLPIANISRIMKTALPENAKIAKDAKECVQECVSEFIGFITSEGKKKILFYSL